MTIIISADKIKEQFPDYDPQHAETYHKESARKADELFGDALRSAVYKRVILLNGGTASGKSEFLATQLVRRRAIILDATLSTELGARNKIRQITRVNKTPVIYSVIPDDLNRAFIAFLNRDRKFSDEHFYKTHAGSRKTLLWIATEYPDIELNIIESSYTSNSDLQFAKLLFGTQEKQIEYLNSIQMTESDIIRTVIS